MPFEEDTESPRSDKGEKVTVIGSFKIGHLLGRGSFCKVKLATHVVSGQQFAVKIIKAVASIKWSDIEREIAVLRKLNHPNIIKLYQVLYSDENKVTHTFCSTATLQSWRPRKLYMIMELAEGGELFDYIIKHNHLEEEEARRFFRQILGGLEYMHSHLVVHRDLKPENIVLDVHRNIKINDFGLSNFISPGSRLKNFCGSPVYAAPEIIRKKTYDGRTADIWSLGVMLFTMVTGHLPWRPSNSNPENYFNMLQGRFTIPSKIRLSQECKDILRRMIHPDPKKRATIRELRNHPWTNEGYAERPPSFNPSYPPVPLDPSIVKRMVQMGFTSKEVQNVVLNNETSPILTTYHAIRNLSLEIVPDFHLHDTSMSMGFTPAAPRHPTTAPPQPTTSPPTARKRSAKAATTHTASPEIPATAHNASPEIPATSHNVSPESARVDIESADVETPPLLAIARDMPQDSPELSTSSPVISTFDELLKLKFANMTSQEYRAVPRESDYYGSSSSSNSIHTSHSLPDRRRIRTPPPSPIGSSPPSPIVRPRCGSDPAGIVPDFDLPEEAAQNHSVSTPNSPQQEILSFDSPSLPASPLPEGGRARALSAGDVGSWSDEFAQEHTNVDSPWTIFETLEDENVSRGFHRQAISSPSISLHQTSSPITVPQSTASSVHHKNHRTHANSSPHSLSPHSAPEPTTPAHAHASSSPTNSNSSSKSGNNPNKLQKLFARFFGK